MTEAVAPVIEFKFTGLPPGEFTGYGAVFGNVDGHGCIIKPGAFADSLAARAREQRKIPMKLQHGLAGDRLPIGTWLSVAEDWKGLRVHGKILAIHLDSSRLHYERMKDGVYGGLSIGGKIIAMRKPTEAEAKGGAWNVITKFDLQEISLVDCPANALAQVDGEFKSSIWARHGWRIYGEHVLDDVAHKPFAGVERVMERAALANAFPAAKKAFDRDIRLAMAEASGTTGLNRLFADLDGLPDRMREMGVL